MNLDEYQMLSDEEMLAFDEWVTLHIGDKLHACVGAAIEDGEFVADLITNWFESTGPTGMTVYVLPDGAEPGGAVPFPTPGSLAPSRMTDEQWWQFPPTVYIQRNCMNPGCKVKGHSIHPKCFHLQLCVTCHGLGRVQDKRTLELLPCHDERCIRGWYRDSAEMLREALADEPQS